MFGFIKRKIREFTDSFKAEAEESVAGDVLEEQAADTAKGAETEKYVDAESDGIEQPGDDASADRERDHGIERAAEPDRSAAYDDERAEPLPVLPSEPHRSPTSVREPAVRGSAEPALPESVRTEPVAPRSGLVAPRSEVKPERAVSATRILAPSTRERSDQQLRGFGKLMGTLTKRSLTDEQFDRIFTDLEIGLLEANTAYDAVQAVKENLRAQLAGERVSRFSAADDVSRALKESITALFAQPEDLVKLADEHAPLVIMLIGINGSGKTTTAAKLARAYQRAGKRPVLAAADTFRAAAIQQLEAHAKALDCRIIKHDYGADPTAVAFDAVSHARSGKADVVLIDTAGRLHSNENLLKELEKLKRIIKPHRIIFVGESIAGNDLLEQAQTFNEKIGIDGIILTKTDVDESGGGMLSVSHVTGKPIDYVCSGQGYDDLTFFSQDTVARLLGLE
jgi:fused signal recognition particle receptor